jgi:hypothetical protein
MVNFAKGTFTVDADGGIEVDYLFDGGWFRGELAVFSLKGMESFTPGSKEFIKEAARRALTNSEQGRILVQDELEGAKFNAPLAWERDFDTGEYRGVKAFNLTPGDEVALMLVQHTTVQKTWQNPNQTSQFGKMPIFSIPEANPRTSSAAGFEFVDVDGSGMIALEDVPIQQADKDYNDMIVDLQGLKSNLSPLAKEINPNRDWRENLILSDGELRLLSDHRLVMHLKLDETQKKQAADSAPEGKKNPGTLRYGAKFHDGVVDFDGKNDLIEVKDSADINTSTYAKRTVSLWFKVDNKDVSDRKQIIYEEGGVNQDNAGLNIYVQNGLLYFGGWNQKNGNWSGTYLSSDDIISNTWHHVALVLDAQPGVKSSQPKAFVGYLDGIKIGEGNGMELESHVDDIGIGGLNETTKFHNGVAQKNSKHTLKGSLDDVRVYNRAFSPEEIWLLFNPNHDPIAQNDAVLTLANTEVTLLGANLLENDTDLDRDRLSITGVANAVNGTVTLDQEGNVLFQPASNFSGDASFEYTVSDGQGGIDTATVAVTVLPATEPIPLGTNLHRLAAWSPQFPFLNAFKSAQRWIPQDWGVTPKATGGYEYIWDTKEFDQLELDEHGWVKSLPAPEEAPQYTTVATLMFRDVGEYRGGKYVVLYKGEGTIEYSLDAQKDLSASTPGRDVIDVNPSNAGILLRITGTDPNDTGNYLRDIQVVPEEYEYAHDQTFNPEFLEKIQPFNTLRFMDWMATNHSMQGAWSDRPTPESNIFSGEIASLESMVELANRTDTDPWFTMPHMATDEYVTNFAQYVKDNLDPELKIYVEYSNEVWNNDFAQGWWVETQGKEKFINSRVGDFGRRLDWFGERTTEISQIWDQVFDTDKERVIGVLGAQAANSWTAKRPLEYAWSDYPLSREESGIDAIAIAPYFGSYIGKPANVAEIESWIDSDQPNLALDNLFKEITQGGVLSNGPQGGALQQAYNWTISYAALAKQQGLELLSYESGQHLNGTNGVQDNQAIGDLLIAANRDPRMGAIYQEYYNTLHELGIDLSMNYTDVSRYNKWGSWGILENIRQSDSPKYNTLKNLTTKVIDDLPPQLGAFDSNLSSRNLLLENEPLNLNLNYTDVNLTDYHTVEIDWGDGSPVDLEEQEPLLGEIGKISATHSYSTEGIYKPVVTVTDDDNLTKSKSLSVTVVKKIVIDWNPDSNDSSIDLSGNGNIKVAILGTKNFDTATIDPTTIRADDRQDTLLDDRDVSALGNSFRLIDTNGDGFRDLEVTFRKSNLRTVIEENSEPFISDRQIYVFGSSSQLDGDFFLGS